ncbi:MAG TPA: surface-adhesin E family protein [Burkholderiaceae bacterium]|nr:surface-adhesin E family protein [Burkholderiaceae bacterium]
MSATLFRNLLASGVLVLSGLSVAPGALAQGRPPTTEELGKDPGALRQLEEQRNAQQLRQQQGQQQQQQDQLYNDALRQQQARQQGDIAQGQAVLRSWQQRPPLAAAQNPLLGRWNSLGSAGAKRSAPGVSPEMAQLVNGLLGGITGGLCDSMLGRGLVEFRPTAVVAIGRDGRERPMYRADYRGGGSRVVVLPQPGQSFTHMIIDFNGPDRATVAAVGCVLVRAGGGAAAATGEAVAAPAELQWVLLGTSAANGGMDIYVARSTIRRAGHSAQMWDLWDFKTDHRFEGKRFLSARNQYEYDCASTRRRMLSTVGYSGHMGQGAVVGSGGAMLAWEPVGASGPIRDYWNIACAKS